MSHELGPKVIEDQIPLKDGRWLVLRRYSHVIESERWPGCLESIDDGSEFDVYPTKPELAKVDIENADRPAAAEISPVWFAPDIGTLPDGSTIRAGEPIRVEKGEGDQLQIVNQTRAALDRGDPIRVTKGEPIQIGDMPLEQAAANARRILNRRNDREGDTFNAGPGTAKRCAECNGLFWNQPFAVADRLLCSLDCWKAATAANNDDMADGLSYSFSEAARKFYGPGSAAKAEFDAARATAIATKARAVADAWNVAGPVPRYHAKARKELFTNWRTLANAVAELAELLYSNDRK